MVFADKLRYSHETGLQTPETTFVFKVLQGEERAKNNLAERQGFEPWRRFPAYTRSRRAPSTTRPPLHATGDSAVQAARQAWGTVELHGDAAVLPMLRDIRPDRLLPY